jgi:hypothetical protein
MLVQDQSELDLNDELWRVAHLLGLQTDQDKHLIGIKILRYATKNRCSMRNVRKVSGAALVNSH